METFIRVDKSNGMITYTHSCPFDPVNGMGKSRTELLKEGFLVTDFPEPKLVEGKRAIPYYNFYTKEISYKYVLIPDSNEDKINYIENALNDIIINNAKNNNDVSQQITETQIALCDIYELLSSIL